MLPEPRYLVFDPEQPDEVVERMRAYERDQNGWMKLQPVTERDHDRRTRVGMFALFSASGPEVPVCTWVPGRPQSVARNAARTKTARGKADRWKAEPCHDQGHDQADQPVVLGPASIGIEHAAGPRTVSSLASHGARVPAGWRVRQDHPKRGLVIEVPAGADHRQVLDWLCRATGVLSTVPFTGRWRATLYTRAPR